MSISGRRRTKSGEPAANSRRSPSRMADVARLADVSVITVSRVLREPARVAEPTRTRVLEAVRTIGYVPNLVASSLKSRRSGIIAAIIPSVAHSIVAEVIRGMNSVLKTEGLHLLLGDSGFSPAEEEELVAAFLARRPDAIYLTGTTHTRNTHQMLDAARIPVIEAGNLTASPIDMSIGYSNREAAHAMTHALIGRGRRRVGYVGQIGRDVIDRVQDRFNGYRDALSANGIAFSPELSAEVELSYRGGAAGVTALLDNGGDVDAVFCTSDVIAVGVLFECQRRGIAVPKRIAITGMDDQEIASQCVPALSTVRIPRYEMGRRAAEMICARLAGAAAEATSIDLGFSLVLRETT
jgi:LacI family gluconate utilization system Gnt-I transcriptional repressor